MLFHKSTALLFKCCPLFALISLTNNSENKESSHFVRNGSIGDNCYCQAKQSIMRKQFFKKLSNLPNEFAPMIQVSPKILFNDCRAISNFDKQYSRAPAFKFCPLFALISHAIQRTKRTRTV